MWTTPTPRRHDHYARLAYWAYRAATRAASPLAHLFLRWRRMRGLEHPTRWRERLGFPSSPPPTSRSSVLWFHAVSLGEGLAAMPLIARCARGFPETEVGAGVGGFTVLMTTTTASAFEVLDAQLPSGVIHQFAPIDSPAAVDKFISYWNPTAIFLMESELWPNLILSAARKGIAVALINARMSVKSFKRWSTPVALPLISLMLSKLSLIVSQSTEEAIRFQLLQAPPFIINFSDNLKYAAADFDVPVAEGKIVKDLQVQLVDRPVWMASSIHHGEEDVMLWIHKELQQVYSNLVTIIVPRHPHHAREIAKALDRMESDAILRSKCQKILPTTKIYIVDTLGELRSLYRITPIAVVGGSFLPNSSGHNISEAAAVGCAVLTGPRVGHFSHMIQQLLSIEPLSVRQVSGKLELLEVIKKLLADGEALEAHRMASRRAFSSLSSGIVGNVCNLINSYILNKNNSNEM